VRAWGAVQSGSWRSVSVVTTKLPLHSPLVSEGRCDERKRLAVLEKMVRSSWRANRRTGRNFFAIMCDHFQAPLLLTCLVSALGAGCWCSCSGVVANPIFRCCCAGAVNALVAAMEPLEHRREAKLAERARKRFKSFEIAAKYRKPGETAPAYDTSRLSLRCGCCRENECGAERFKFCNGYKIVAFCSSECQRQHWARHQEECKAVQKGEIPKENATRPRRHGAFRHS
jgi:hypothetical protein